MKIEETNMLLRDLDDIRQVLAAVLNYHQATDLANAQLNLAEVRYRPLTEEVARVKQRVDGYMGDYALRRLDEEGWREEEEDEETQEIDLGLEEAEKGAQSVTAPLESHLSTPEDILTMKPLGQPKSVKRGRRVEGKELKERQGGGTE